MDPWRYSAQGIAVSVRVTPRGRVREAGPLQDLVYFDAMAGDEP